MDLLARHPQEYRLQEYRVGLDIYFLWSHSFIMLVVTDRTATVSFLLRQSGNKVATFPITLLHHGEHQQLLFPPQTNSKTHRVEYEPLPPTWPPITRLAAHGHVFEIPADLGERLTSFWKLPVGEPPIDCEGFLRLLAPPPSPPVVSILRFLPSNSTRAFSPVWFIDDNNRPLHVALYLCAGFYLSKLGFSAIYAVSSAEALHRVYGTTGVVTGTYVSRCDVKDCDSPAAQKCPGCQSLLTCNKHEAEMPKHDCKLLALVYHPGVIDTASLHLRAEIKQMYCAQCPAWGSLRCSRCRRVKYCSATCQAAHWKLHKQTCRTSPS